MFDLAHYRQYRAWIFDLDGTLSNTLQAHDLAWQHALDHFAIPYTAERMQQLGGVPIPDTVEILAREAGMTVDVKAVVTRRDARFYQLLPSTLSATPLVAGVVDAFRAEGHRIFGPTAAAAQLEGSKAYAKDFLQRHGIPTAFYEVHTDIDAALAFVRAKGAPIVANDVSAVFKRPVDEREDFTLALQPAGQGLFTAERDIIPGQWVIDISTKQDGRKVFHQTLRMVVAGGAK